MENIILRYELIQGGKTYKISTQINQGKFIITCEELNYETPIIYIAEFYPKELTQLSSLFASMSNIYEAQNIFDEIFTSQRTSIEFQNNHINLKIFIIKEDGIEECFSLQLYNQNKAKINTSKLITLPPRINQINSNGGLTNQNSPSPRENITNNTVNITPSNNTQNKIIQLPTRNIGNLNMYITPTKNRKNSDIQLIKKIKKKRVDKITLSLTPEPRTEAESESKSNRFLIHNSSSENIIPISQNSSQSFISPELEHLKNENNKLNKEIIELKKQIQRLIQENNNLKKMNKENGKENQKILLLQGEIEKYITDINELRKELSNFEEYKRKKENEINSLILKNDELLLNQSELNIKKIQNQKEIKELKQSNEELLKLQKWEEIKKEEQRNKHLEYKQMKNIRLEIIKGDIIRNNEELELLTRKIGDNKRKIILNLIYKASFHSDRAEAFHKKCDSAKSTLVLVETVNGKRFGGYTSKEWKGICIEKKDNNAFIFSLDKMNIYDIIPGEDAIGCFPRYGPIFSGCQIRIFDRFFTYGGTTFLKGVNFDTDEDYELTGGLEKFNILDLEVYSIEME